MPANMPLRYRLEQYRVIITIDNNTGYFNKISVILAHSPKPLEGSPVHG